MVWSLTDLIHCYKCAWVEPTRTMSFYTSYRVGRWSSLTFDNTSPGCTEKEIPGGNPAPSWIYSTAYNPRMRDFPGIFRSSLVIGQPRGSQESFQHGSQQESHLLKLMWNRAKYLQIYLTYVLWKWFKLLRKIYRIDRDGKIRTTMRGAVIWGKWRFS